MKSSRPTAVPKHMQTIYDAVVALIDAFCRDHLTDEYRDLARAMTAALCRKRPSPLARHHRRRWSPVHDRDASAVSVSFYLW